MFCVGTDDVVYDYAKGNLENNYTSLDMSKVENTPTYQSLINNTHNNVVSFLIFVFRINIFQQMSQLWQREVFSNEFSVVIV